MVLAGHVLAVSAAGALAGKHSKLPMIHPSNLSTDDWPTTAPGAPAEWRVSVTPISTMSARVDV